jgi:hypothetical protein
METKFLNEQEQHAMQNASETKKELQKLSMESCLKELKDMAVFFENQRLLDTLEVFGIKSEPKRLIQSLNQSKALLEAILKKLS